MSSERDLRSPRTAGVASFECLPSELEVGCGGDMVVEVGLAEDDCSDVGVGEEVSAEPFTCSDSEAAGAMRASSSGLISL